jgi:6-pyruvoyltetrahydropterin/6-carboxytetrahydropterin synthase
VDGMSLVYLSRRELFSASHRLHSNKLTAEENKNLFGKCNSQNGHGHNYIIEVIVRGAVDDRGLTMNLNDLKQIIADEILARFDHKHLNLDCKEFVELNPTAENIAIVCWKILKAKLPILHEVKIHETEKNVAIYRGE